MRRIAKGTVIRARCDGGLKRQLEQVAAIQQLDVSDIIRIACTSYVLRFQQPAQNLYAQGYEFSRNAQNQDFHANAQAAGAVVQSR